MALGLLLGLVGEKAFSLSEHSRQVKTMLHLGGLIDLLYTSVMFCLPIDTDD